MIERITQRAYPRVIIFELDYFMLNDAYAVRWKDKSDMDFTWSARSIRNGLIRLSPLIQADPTRMVSVAPKYFMTRAREDREKHELVGFGAIAHEFGFRFDGSVLYDKDTIAAAPTNNQHIGQHLLGALPTGNGRSISPSQLDQLRQLGELAREHNIILIGLQLPYIKTAVDILDSGQDFEQFLGSDAGVWRQLGSPDTRRMLRRLGIIFFDASHDPASADSQNFIDPAHPAESGVLSALSHLTEDPDFHVLFPKMDAQVLKSHSAGTRVKDGPLDVYHSRF
jgi:hypothetical protein